MKELVQMLEDLAEKYGISEEDITMLSQKIGQVVGPEVAAELAQDEGAGEEGGEFDDLGGADGEEEA